MVANNGSRAWATVEKWQNERNDNYPKRFGPETPKPVRSLNRDINGPIYGFLLHLSRQASTAEDLTQETFAAAWKAIGSFHGRSSFATWLHRIAYGKFIDFKRRDKRGQAVMEQLADRQTSPTALRSPLAQAMANECSRHIYEALQNLDPADREVIVLHYFQSLSFSQMATVLDEPLGTVKWRTSRALGQLKISLDGRI